MTIFRALRDRIDMGADRETLPVRRRRTEFRAWLIRRLGMAEGGAFGGVVAGSQRWCLKELGHSDSCAFDVLPDEPASQPGYVLRMRFRGWAA